MYRPLLRWLVLGTTLLVPVTALSLDSSNIKLDSSYIKDVTVSPAPDSPEAVFSLPVFAPLFPDAPNPIGRGLLEFYGCITCHNLPITPFADRRGPDLDRIGDKTTPEWLGRFLEDPPAVAPNTRMPNPHLSDAERDTLVSFLTSQSGPIILSDSVPGNPAGGRSLYVASQCQTCHGREGLGPSLETVSAKIRKPWMVSYLMSPTSVLANAQMPAYAFSRGQAEDLSAYLLGKEPIPKPEESSIASNPIGLSTFVRKGCAGCHRINAYYHPLNLPSVENQSEFKLDSDSFLEASICRGDLWDCHMPDRRHLWQGIHDPGTVRDAMEVTLNQEPHADSLVVNIRLTNSGSGHHLPTYVTPKILVRASLLDTFSRQLSSETRAIGREVNLTTSESREVFDTRIPAGANWKWRYATLKSNLVDILDLVITVHPDHFYLGFFEAYDRSALSSVAAALIDSAEASARSSVYILAEKQLKIYLPEE